MSDERKFKATEAPDEEKMHRQIKLKEMEDELEKIIEENKRLAQAIERATEK